MKKVHHMSKLEVLQGGKKPIKSVDLNHIAFLEDEIRLRNGNLTTKECYIFAYQFAVAGDSDRAVKYLNQIGSFYYIHGIYKDLYKALLAWSLYKRAPDEQKAKLQKNYEFFIVARRSLDEFEKLRFRDKKHFMEMAKHFKKESTFTVL